MPYYNQFQKQILIENNQIFKIDQYLPIIIEAHGATNPAAGNVSLRIEIIFLAIDRHFRQ